MKTHRSIFIFPLGIISILLMLSCANQRNVLKGSSQKSIEVDLILVDSIKTLSPTVTAQVVRFHDEYFIYTGGEGTVLEANRINSTGELTTGNQTKITDKFGGIRGLTNTRISNKDILIVGNKAENAVEIHEIRKNGELAKLSGTKDTDSTYLYQNITIELVEIKEKKFVFVGGLDTGLSCFELSKQGKLKHIQSIADNSAMFLDGIIGMTTLVIDGKTFLFTGGFIDGGISSFRVFEDGSFENIDNIKDDENLFLTGTFSLSSVQLAGNNFVMVSHRHKAHYPFYEKEKGLVYHGDGINVFSVNSTGKFSLSHLLKDTERLKLKGSTRIEVIKITNEQAIVLIATRDDKSLQIASLNSKGILTPIQNYDLNCSVYNGMTIEKIDNQWFVFIGDYKKHKIHSYLLKIEEN